MKNPRNDAKERCTFLVINPGAELELSFSGCIAICMTMRAREKKPSGFNCQTWPQIFMRILSSTYKRCAVGIWFAKLDHEYSKFLLCFVLSEVFRKLTRLQLRRGKSVTFYSELFNKGVN